MAFGASARYALPRPVIEQYLQPEQPDGCQVDTAQPLRQVPYSRWQRKRNGASALRKNDALDRVIRK
jgi:hypothetical protein